MVLNSRNSSHTRTHTHANNSRALHSTITHAKTFKRTLQHHHTPQHSRKHARIKTPHAGQYQNEWLARVPVSRNPQPHTRGLEHANTQARGQRARRGSDRNGLRMVGVSRHPLSLTGKHTFPRGRQKETVSPALHTLTGLVAAVPSSEATSDGESFRLVV